MAKIVRKPFSEIEAVDVAKAGDTAEGLDQVQAFLARFGYISGQVAESNSLDTGTTRALRRYQKFFDLKRTGNFDAATKEHML
jgi:hypothetical protein